MGKPKYIETPERMWELFTEYRQHVKNNPFVVIDWVGAKAVEVEREKEKPLTMEGFELYLFEQDIIDGVDQYFSNFEGRYTDYLAICSRIRKAIREDQISGGMAGLYNPSITQRLNGLVDKSAADDKKDVTIKVKYERNNDNPEFTS